MARKVKWTAAAWSDLEEAADYIARDSPNYAAALVREVREAARSLSCLAGRGSLRFRVSAAYFCYDLPSYVFCLLVWPCQGSVKPLRSGY